VGSYFWRVVRLSPSLSANPRAVAAVMDPVALPVQQGSLATASLAVDQKQERGSAMDPRLTVNAQAWAITGHPTGEVVFVHQSAVQPDGAYPSRLPLGEG
jgi:hypothetical protein